MYIDAENAGGLVAQRVDGRPVVATHEVTYDGSGRVVGTALMVTGGSLAVVGLIMGPIYLGMWGGARTWSSGSTSSSGLEPFLYAGISLTTVGLLGAGLSGLGYYFSQTAIRRTQSRTARVGVIPTLQGFSVAGMF